MESGVFSFQQYFYIYATSMILSLGAIVVLLSNAFARHLSRSTSIALCAIFIIAALLFSSSISHTAHIARAMYFAESLLLISALGFIFLSFSKYRFIEFQTQEFYPLYLFSLSGFTAMVCADNFVVMLLGLEIGSLPICALMAFSKKIYGIEAGVKYFISSVLASMFLLVGIMLFYLYSGNFYLESAMQFYSYHKYYDSVQNTIIVLCGAMFFIAALGFKVSLIPWHTWMPDIYEGSNPMLAGYISVVPKIAGFAVFFTIFEPIFSTDSGISFFDKLFKILLFLTITIPNIAALLQKDVKRMLAFSSISHSGFALACIYLNTFETLIIYWILFFITNLGCFALLWCNTPTNSNNRFDYSFSRFCALHKTKPIMALALALFMIALAGIPPFSIFWGKIFVISSALSNNEFGLAFVMLLNSAIAVCYYLKLPVMMFFKSSATQDSATKDFTLRDSKVRNSSSPDSTVLTTEYMDNSTLPIRSIIFICLVLVVFSVFLVSYLFNII